jgi:hypothetical protein
MSGTDWFALIGGATVMIAFAVLFWRISGH